MYLSQKVGYNTPLHTKIKESCLKRRDFSEKKMAEFRKQWDDADDSMKAYIKESDLDKKRKNKKRFDGEMDYVTLEVPYTYAIVATAHTYYSSVLLGRSPIWQFTGRHGESQDSIEAVEAVMDYQMKNGVCLPVMYNWIWDLAKYSLGIVGNYFDKEERMVARFENQQPSIMGIPFGAPKLTRVEEIVPGYVGNKLFNVRPHDFYPDPRVPIWRFQEGEFCGVDAREGFHTLLAAEHVTKGYYCNLDVLQRVMKEGGNDMVMGSSNLSTPTAPGEGNSPGPGFCEIHESYIRLIPNMWGLGPSQRQELWCFQIANKEVVISAKPLGLYHDKFPYAVMEGNFGSDEFAKSGMTEMIRPLTDIMSWLVNSHFYNVRRVLNNQVIVDPSRVVMKDVTKPGQRVIRLKPTSYGSDVRTMISQLQMVDVTQGHLGNVQFIEQMIQRCSAVVDTVMGVQESGGRRSATETRTTTGWSTSRLKTPVEYNSALAMSPLAQMMLSNTQQFYDFNQKFAIAGNTMNAAKKFAQVDPAVIAGAYDFVPIDGTAPIDRLAQATFWKEMLGQMAKVPEIAAEWDLGGMAVYTMMMQGERNIERFRKPPQVNVLPPGVAPGQDGNVVPLQGVPSGGGRPGATAQPGRRAKGSAGRTI